MCVCVLCVILSQVLLSKPWLQGDTMCIWTAMAEGLDFDDCVAQMRQLLASDPSASASAPAPSDGPSGSATTPSAPLSPELPSAPSEATLSAPMSPGHRDAVSTAFLTKMRIGTR